jgi:hypothetical protein
MCEQDPYMRGDEDQALEEIRRLFERYRACARQSDRFDEDDEQAAELPDRAPVLTLR